MRTRLTRPWILAVTATSVVAVGTLAIPAARAADCPDVQLVFARGTGEAPGLGILGRPLAQQLTAALPNRSVAASAVNYAANASQTSAGPGATNMVQQVTSLAGSCPDTEFVLGGYSQGATVTDLALGIRAGIGGGTSLPSEAADKVAAVVVFGNPLGLQRQTIARANPQFASRTKEFCATGDPVCGGGANFAAHLAYASNGAVREAAQFAASQVERTGAGDDGSAGGGAATGGSASGGSTSGSGGSGGTTGGGLGSGGLGGGGLLGGLGGGALGGGLGGLGGGGLGGLGGGGLGGLGGGGLGGGGLLGGLGGGSGLGGLGGGSSTGSQQCQGLGRWLSFLC